MENTVQNFISEDLECAKTAAGIYVHIPFCERKCSYCAFYVTTRHLGLIDRYLAAIEAELTRLPALHAQTVFFGGGTPSMLSAAQLEHLCAVLLRRVDESGIQEWSIEANPGTLSPAKLKVLREAGVNRVSIGAQGFDDALLKKLGRTHTCDDISKTVAIARSGGIEFINLDLIASIPGCTAAAWSNTLDRALELEPDHLSVYALSLDEGAALNRLAGLGRFGLLDDDKQLDALHEARDRLERAGFEQYEISNYARPGARCLHNLACWQGQDYVGLGPAAASRVRTARWTNTPDLEAYVRAAESGDPPPCAREDLGPLLDRAERLAFGLRMSNGVPSPNAVGFEDVLESLASDGLLGFDGGNWVLTTRGQDMADHVARQVLELATRSESAASTAV